MSDEPTPDPADIETRTATLPDGTTMVIAVKRGLTQAEVDLMAARLWQDVPES